MNESINNSIKFSVQNRLNREEEEEIIKSACLHVNFRSSFQILPHTIKLRNRLLPFTVVVVVIYFFLVTVTIFIIPAS
jgi:hypothetical protein